MLEKLLKKIRMPAFALSIYALGMSGCGGCGDTPFGSGDVRRDAGSGETQAPDAGTYCADNDNDGFYNLPGCGTEVDCDDYNDNTFPGVLETCDHEDNDCDGDIDEGAGRTVYLDADGDGFGDRNRTAVSCYDIMRPGVKDKMPELEGYVYNPYDCDDRNSEVNPDALEQCNGVDYDCDGTPYNGYPVGEPCTNEMPGICMLPGEYVCSDDETNVLCNAPEGIPEEETCDGLDNNCDGLSDNDLEAASRECLRGVGECVRSGLEYQVCLGERGWSREYFDCDAVPAAPVEELCDNLDNDCNSVVDNFMREVDCPIPIRTYTRECIEGEWSDINLESCPECVPGVRENLSCGYDGCGTRTRFCELNDDRGGIWVDDRNCDLEDFINASNHPAWDGQPDIDGDNLVFTSLRTGRSQIYIVNTRGLEISSPSCISCDLPEPGYMRCGSWKGACDWTSHYCYDSSISEKVAFECTWIDYDPANADDPISRFSYLLNPDDPSAPDGFRDLYTENNLLLHVPSIDEDMLAAQNGTTIRVYSSVTGIEIQNFGSGDEPDISSDYVVFSREGPVSSRGVYLAEIGVEEEPLRIYNSAPGDDGYNPAIHGNDVIFVGELNRLHHYDITTSELTQLTGGCGPHYEPSINNRKVAFTSERIGDNLETYVCNLEETTNCCDDAVNISDSPSTDNAPSISGCKIAYVSDRDGNEEIYVHDLCEREGRCPDE